MKPNKKKSGVALLCIAGMCAVAYGVGKGNDIVFLAGIILVIAGYLLIRKRLKDSVKNT